MKKFAFYIFLLLVGALLIVLSFISKNEASAMVARVESRVLAVSYEDPVKVEKIHVVPGQRVKQGEILIEVSSPKIALDIEQKRNELTQLELEAKSVEEELTGKIGQIETEYTAKIQEEKNELELLQSEMKSRSASGRIISNLTGGESVTDSLALLRIRNKEMLIKNLIAQKSKETNRLTSLRENQLRIFSSKKEIIEKELAALYQTQAKLIYKADQAGTVGNVFVEFNELVPSFNKLLTIYELQPSMIKAYVEESIVANLKVGQKVRAKAANREIWTEGTIEEFGTRVTDYPMQITMGAETKYGQEVFIRIPNQHAFLDGEKVFVYPDIGS